MKVANCKKSIVYDTRFGPVFSASGWIPAPRYLMRRARILDLTLDLSPGSLLEIGPGVGALLMEFANKGFRCEALEISEQAREIARKCISESGLQIAIHGESRPEWLQCFDSIFAFDVLEHIEEDVEALRQWYGWLKPGGVLMLSVPARMKLWTTGDQWAGHFRRYERRDLLSLLQVTGFNVERFECYGFPLTNITEKLGALAYKKMTYEADIPISRQHSSHRSGVERKQVMKFLPFVQSRAGRFVMEFFIQSQKLFLKSDLGSGYVLKAIRQ